METSLATLYGLQSAFNWPLRGGSISGISYSGHTNQLAPVSNGNDTGDWMCTCGFHNYSSRLQCKKCNAHALILAPSSLVNPVTALGTKRLASEEFVHNLDNKRLNAGQAHGLQQLSSGFESFQNPGGGQLNSIYPPIPSEDATLPPNWLSLQISRLPPTPSLVGKGAKGIGCVQIAIITIMLGDKFRMKLISPILGWKTCPYVPFFYFQFFFSLRWILRTDLLFTVALAVVRCTQFLCSHMQVQKS